MQILSHSMRTYPADLGLRMIRETESYLNRRLQGQFGRPLNGGKGGGKSRPASRAAH